MERNDTKMSNIRKYLKKKMAMLSLALANIEKNSLSQKGDSLEKNINHELKLNQGTLMQSLINGEITQEVKNLRWRMYKVDKATQKLRTKYVGSDEDGDPIYRGKTYDETESLDIIKIDKTDKYKLIMVFKNQPILNSFAESFENIEVKEYEGDLIEKYKEVGNTDMVRYTGDTENDGNNPKPIGIVSLNSANETIELNYPLVIDRNFIHKYEIEKFVEYVHVKKIDGENYMLELLIPETPNPNKEYSKSLVKDLKKSLSNIAHGGFLEIDKLMFITNKTLGALDNLLYEYDNIKLEKITTFNNFYVIKYRAKILINGQYLLADFIEKELDEKYKNKEKRK